VTLSPSFMPHLLTLVPPLLSDLVPCDTARRRCRRGHRLHVRRLRLHRRWCRSGHRRRWWRRRWACAACGDERQTGRDHQRFTEFDHRSLPNRAATTPTRIASPSFNQKGRSFSATIFLSRVAFTTALMPRVHPARHRADPIREASSARPIRHKWYRRQKGARAGAAPVFTVRRKWRVATCCDRLWEPARQRLRQGALPARNAPTFL
jgi:hypothetical protein